jgi:hypothetical protein
VGREALGPSPKQGWFARFRKISLGIQSRRHPNPVTLKLNTQRAQPPTVGFSPAEPPDTPNTLDQGERVVMKIQSRIAVCLVMSQLGLAACGGGGGAGPSTAPPPADFAVSVSPSSLSVIEGGTSGSATVSVSPVNGFTGTVAVTIAGLPTGATTNPSSLTISVGSPQSFTVTTTDATHTGTVSLTLHAASGSLAHDATVSLTTNPVIQTSQSGTILYLQSHGNGHTARIGIDTAWGGAIVEASMDGTNFVNAHDTGREVQPALYDGADKYPWPNMTVEYGWDPVLGGDALNQGSPVLDQRLDAVSVYTETVPLQWNPEHYGGGAGAPVRTDTTFEQTITVAPGSATAFQVHYRITHTGSDTHYNTGQEFPAVYVNSSYRTFAYYDGTSPWTNGSVTTASAAANPSGYAPEQSAALVDANNQGLTVFVPGVYPYWSASWPDQSAGDGPTASATVYMAPMASLTIQPGQVIEGDVYVIPGDAAAARAEVYALHQALPSSNIVTPLVTMDVPAPNATISGSGTQMAGWAFGNSAVSAVMIYVDGLLKGSATLGGARPDVAAAYPHLAPADSGWSYSLDTATLTNGVHSLVVHATDSSGNEAVAAPVSVTITN